MEKLQSKYKKKLKAIKEEMLDSDVLAQYLENEEEEQYQALREAYEPKIHELYSEIAENDPLQLMAFEKEVVDPELEGLYLPRILGYTVLRGHLDDEYRYSYPQNHFKDVLMAICESSNFGYIRKRIGQTVQVGFALSSNIWKTNLLNNIPLKRVRNFLNAQNLDKYHDSNERRIAFGRYALQFKKENFYTADFPSTLQGLQVNFPSLYNFLKWRVQNRHGQNSQLIERIEALLENPEFADTPEHLRVLGLYVYFFDLNKKQKESVTKLISKMRKEKPDWFQKEWLEFLKEMDESSMISDGEAQQRATQVFDSSIKDDLGKYYALLNEIHTKGFTHEDVVAAVRGFYERHAGLSTINEAVRRVILGYFKRFIVNLEPQEYSAWIDITKSFPVYMDIFNNEEFNQSLKYLSMDYVKKLIKTYTDKRGKDYQDIKRYVATNFLDWNFLSEKQIKELFKTKRKKRTTTAK